MECWLKAILREENNKYLDMGSVSIEKRLFDKPSVYQAMAEWGTDTNSRNNGYSWPRNVNDRNTIWYIHVYMYICMHRIISLHWCGNAMAHYIY